MKTVKRQAPDEHADTERRRLTRAARAFGAEIAKQSTGELCRGASAHQIRSTCFGERERAGGDHSTIGRDFTLDLVEAAHLSYDPCFSLQRYAGRGSRREFEWPKRSDSQFDTCGRLVGTGRGGGKTACLREKFDKHNCRYDRLAGKVALKKPVVGPHDTPAGGGNAGHQIDDLFHEAHRRRVWQQVDACRHWWSIQFALDASA
jgi:hypothetical protein